MAKFIAIEGIDGAGKTVQCEQLVARLQRSGLRTLYRSYPQYSSFFGLHIGDILKGCRANTLDPYSMALWYASDRRSDFDRNIKHALDDIDVVVLNRYTLSSAVYQSLRSKDQEETWEWIFHLENNELFLPFPDIYIIIDVDNDTALSRNILKSGRDYISEGADCYELDTTLQENARRSYRAFAESNNSAVLIDHSTFHGATPELIADAIADIIRRNLNLPI